VAQALQGRIETETSGADVFEEFAKPVLIHGAARKENASLPAAPGVRCRARLFATPGPLSRGKGRAQPLRNASECGEASTLSGAKRSSRARWKA
jgi:hypothetical protein